MSYAVKVDDASCRHCEAEEVYVDLKEEVGVYKIGAMCHDCNRDYGVLDRMLRSDIDHLDDAWDQAEDVVRSYMD